jgi:hypothetical protein
VIPRIFAGATVFIVAGGPSLIGFDFARLAGRHVIAINRAHEVLVEATILWWSDILFWLRNREALLAHKAPWKATGIENRRDSVKYPSEVAVYDFTGMTGFDDRPGCLRHGNNSSYAAIHLAAQLGAKRIVLLGVDMKHGPAGETHFHTGHGLVRQERTLTEKMLPHFESLAPALAERGVEIVNANPESALAIWPRCSIDAALA